MEIRARHPKWKFIDGMTYIEDLRCSTAKWTFLYLHYCWSTACHNTTWEIVSAGLAVELERNINNVRTWTISDPCRMTGKWSSWNVSLVAPDWYKGKASNVRFYARHGRYFQIDYKIICMEVYGGRSTHLFTK